MSRTITSAYSTLLTLSGPGDNPITVTSGALLEFGLYGGSIAAAWVVTNAGDVFGAGIGLASSGTVTNTGSIGTSASQGPGISLAAGGSVTNGASGVITGSYAIYIVGGTGEVENSGRIAVSTTSGVGVFISRGGWVTNASTATITGGASGVKIYSGTGTVANDGSITATGTNGDGVLSMFGDLTVENGPSASIIGFLDGINAIFGRGVVTNSGEIQATSTLGDGVDLYSGGSVSNSSSGYIQGGIEGINVQGGAGTVANAGTVEGNGHSFGSGIALESYGGSITNSQSGLIAGAYRGLNIGGGPIVAGGATVQNYGTILGGVGTAALTGRGKGIEIYSEFLGGAILNSAGAYISGPRQGVYITGGIGTITNAGTISGTDSDPNACGVWLTSGGSVTNVVTGTIAGGADGVRMGASAATVINAGTILGARSNGDGVSLFSGTVVNEPGGTISGSNAVQFLPGTADRVVDSPGATFIGVVDGGNTIGSTIISTLELASATSAGTLTGLGSQFVDFGGVEVDSGADWLTTDGLGTAAGATGPIALDQNSTLQVQGAFGPYQTIVSEPQNHAQLALDGGGEASAAQLPTDSGNTLEFGTSPGQTPTFALAGTLYAKSDTIIDGSTLDLSTASSAGFAANLQLTNGGLQLGTNTATAYAGIQQAGGTIAGTGTLSLNGNNTLSSGLQTGSGTTHLIALSELTGVEQLDGGRILENDGVLSLSSGELRLGAGDSSAATHTATLSNTGVIGITGSARISAPNGSGLVDNAGIITATLDAATRADIDAPVSNTGIITVRSGTLSLNGGGSAFGAGLSVSAGATLQFGAPTDAAGSTFAVRGALRNEGTVMVSAGTVTLAGAGNGAGTFVLDGSATLDFINGTGTGASLGFLHPGGTLEVDTKGEFGAALTGFGGGDVLDAASVSAGPASATFALGTLTVSDGQHATAFRLTGTYIQANFHLTNDGNGGTAITYG